MYAHVFRRRAGVVCMTLARYLLGLGMLPYATSKLERIQFELPAWDYAQPLSHLRGSGLLWATMGYSPRLQMFLGVLELVPALLVLVRRTRRIGALLMLPVVANVWVLNMGLDLWPATKVISGFFLVLNLFLIVYDFRLYRRFFSELLTSAEPVGSVRQQYIGLVASYTVPVVAIGLFLMTVERQVHAMHSGLEPFIGARQINGAGTWRIQSVSIDGKPFVLPSEEKVLYFDFGSRVVTGTPDHPVIAHYKTDSLKRSVNITGLQIANSASPIEAFYTSTGDTLRLSGTRDSKRIELALVQDHWATTKDRYRSVKARSELCWWVAARSRTRASLQMFV